MQNLQQRLGDDSTGAAGAMVRLRINADAFNKLDTYTQMTTLADAVRGIESPTEQASIAAALFGKTWKEILPAIKSGMKEVGDQAPIMADSTIKSLDRVGDALTRSKQQAVSWGGGVVLAIEGAGFAVGDFLSKFNPEHFGLATSEVLKLEAALNDPTGLAGALGKIPPVAAHVGASLDDLTLKGQKLKDVENELVLTLMRSEAAERAAAKAATEHAAVEAENSRDMLAAMKNLTAFRESADARTKQIDAANIKAVTDRVNAEVIAAATAAAAFEAMNKKLWDEQDAQLAAGVAANRHAKELQQLGADAKATTGFLEGVYGVGAGAGSRTSLDAHTHMTPE